MNHHNMRSNKELDLLDKLKFENKKLKRQLRKLRKQISRLDLDRYQNIKDLVDKFAGQEEAAERKRHKEEVRKLWKCFDCGDGCLRMVILERRDGTHYYRQCDYCNNRTKLQKLKKNTKRD